MLEYLITIILFFLGILIGYLWGASYYYKPDMIKRLACPSCKYTSSLGTFSSLRNSNEYHCRFCHKIFTPEEIREAARKFKRETIWTY
ncbi:MAG: hypothetical protein GY861_18815 [bacterium]|nr:hypothetical protein [bacterium]